MKSSPLQPGVRVGPYRLETPIGSGGIAVVYRARDASGRAVAIKALRGVIDEEQAKRLSREYQTLRRLNHPNIVQVLDAGEHHGVPWLAMEYVPGGDLDALISTWKEAPPPDRWIRTEALLRQLCAALSSLHETGAVHRDLKPSNVLIDAEGRAKLTDFGGVKDDGFDTKLTQMGQIVGTIAFVAPEQIHGDPVDARTDLYALGAVLYVLLTGTRPFEADSVAGFLARHLIETPRPPSQHTPDVPPKLDQICMRLLNKDPGERYPSARAVIAALDEEEDEIVTPLRGRDAALEMLDLALDQLEGAEKGGAMVALGPSGSGRTALLSEAQHRARARGLPTVWCSGREPNLVVPERFLSLGAPRLIVLDDLDRASIHTLSPLLIQLRHSPGVLVIWSAAETLPTDATPSAAALRAFATASQELPLPPLRRDDLRAVFWDRGLRGVAAAALAHRLSQDLNGRPGAAVEQFERLIEAGWLAPKGGALRLAVPIIRLREGQLPMTDGQRRGVLDQVDVLPEGTRTLLEVLAVLDEPVTTDLLQSLRPHDDAQLDLLAVRALVSLQDHGMHRVISLSSDLVRRALYEDLERPQRQDMHRSLGEAILARHSRRPSTVAALVARHLLKGDAPGPAWPLLAQASRRAARRGDWQQVIGITELALAYRQRAERDLGLKNAAPSSARILFARGHALVELGRTHEAQAALEEAVSLGLDERADAKARALLTQID